MIAAEWQLVFTKRHVDEDDMRHFLIMILVGAGATDRCWPNGRISDAAAAMPASAPSPDGLPYSCWAAASPTVVRHLDDVAEEATDTAKFPPHVA